MTVEEILKLHELGYTKEEIASMEAPKEEPKEEPKEDPKEEPKEDPKGAPDMANVLKQMQHANAELLKQIKELQAENVKGARGPEPKKEITSADVIADFMKHI